MPKHTERNTYNVLFRLSILCQQTFPIWDYFSVNLSWFLLGLWMNKEGICAHILFSIDVLIHIQFFFENGTEKFTKSSTEQIKVKSKSHHSCLKYQFQYVMMMLWNVVSSFYVSLPMRQIDMFSDCMWRQSCVFQIGFVWILCFENLHYWTFGIFCK